MRVLINRTDAIGDTLLTLPMVEKIKSDFPDAIIGLIVSNRSADYIPLIHGIDHYWVINKTDSMYSKLKKSNEIINEFRPDTYFFVGGTQVPTFISWLKRVPFRGGLVSKVPSILFLNKGIRQSRSIVAMHESDYNLNLLNSLGTNFLEKDRDKFGPKFQLVDSEVAISIKNLFNDKPQKDFIVIHPGMTGHTLNWSSRNYGRLIERLKKLYNNKYQFVVSFTPSDEQYLVGLIDYLKNSDLRDLFNEVIFYDGTVHGLREYIHMLSKSSLFIGPSTGTTHIANLLKVPQVSIYSPIKVQSSMRWGPFYRNDNVKVVYPDVVCGEQFQCAGSNCSYYECMSKIEVDDIFKSCQNLLDKGDSV